MAFVTAVIGTAACIHFGIDLPTKAWLIVVYAAVYDLWGRK